MSLTDRPDRFPIDEQQTLFNNQELLDSSAPTQETAEQHDVPDQDTRYESTTVTQPVQPPELAPKPVSTTLERGGSPIAKKIAVGIFGVVAAGASIFGVTKLQGGEEASRTITESAEQPTEVTDTTIAAEIHDENDMIVEGTPWYSREFIPKETKFGEPIETIVQNISTNIYRGIVSEGKELRGQYKSYVIGDNPDPDTEKEFDRFFLTETEVFRNSDAGVSTVDFVEDIAMRINVIGTEDIGDSVIRVTLEVTNPVRPDSSITAVWDIASATGFQSPDSDLPEDRPIVVGYPYPINP